ncbi:MAG: efflux RND transporter permease subunit [Thermoanaerobaculales bacterium]|jgi:multidrug efflux pump subunit AcrB|nr:efflux RND transporter permease subunit [Thermoanaerobaculales bacterium]
MTDSSRDAGARPGDKPSPQELDEARREAMRLKMTRRKLGMAGRIGAAFLSSKLTPLIIVASLLLGAFAIMVTPSEEEPQIKVPMIDVMVGFPGATAEEVENLVITPLEKLLYEIENVEYIYSISRPSGGFIVVRFLVGTDPDQAAVRVHSKIASVTDELPVGVVAPVVKPRTIDDVPVVAYTLWGEHAEPNQLKRIADELKVELTKHPRVAQVSVIGGQRRVVRVDLDRERLASYNVSILQIHQALAAVNWRLPAGASAVADTEVLVDVGEFLADADDVADVVVGAHEGRPVYLKDVGEIADGPDDPTSYVWLGSGPAAPEKGLERAGLDLPAVTLSVAKKPGTNAVDMVADLDRALARLEGRVIPSDVELLKTRDYGATAKEKSDELLKHLWSATLAVILLMWVTLSRREAIVVAVVIPVTLALTLAASYFFGYTLNRVSLFALVFSIGILVDDAIVVVENIHRHIKLGWGRIRQATVYAVDEVGNPTILATFAIISALLPLAFVRGLMGPYMRPIPINASAAMLFSLGVAFTISPWLAYRLFKKEAAGRRATDGPPEDTELPEEGRIARFYDAAIKPMIRSKIYRYLFLAGVALLLVGAMTTVAVGFTTVKMLPHDNKSELQVVIDAPEGFTLERTNAAARELASVFRTMPEVTDYQVYVGTSAPFNFNGLVRHYFLRSGANVADIQVNFVHKEKRDLQSHDLARVVRDRLQPIADSLGVAIKVAEIPPGPPVMSTLVAEVYGPTLAGRLEVADEVREVFASTDGVVDVDWEVEATTRRLEIVVDREKAILAGVTVEQVARTLRVALDGAEAGLVHDPTSRDPVPVRLRLDRAQRAHIDDLLQLSVHGGEGRLVPLSEIATVVDRELEQSRYHKNLQPVTYVYGEVAGRFEAPVYAILEMEKRLGEIVTPLGEPLEVIATSLPEDSSRFIMKWDGEWHITYEVFRDMGIAFAVVMVLIYVLMVGWFRSFVTPVIIMVPIPLTLVGILPAHGIFGVFFTATSMIGFIALAGIIVRNSILLVDFINLELRAGEPLEEAVVKAGGVRLLPILLTQLSTIVGAAFMLSDPIFQGLALAMISGIVVSTALTVGVIPVLYYMYLKSVGVENVVEVD